MRTGLANRLTPGVCRECGCTALSGCVDPDTREGCSWTDETKTFCTVCAILIGRSFDFYTWAPARAPMVTRENSPEEALELAVGEAKLGYLVRVCSMCQDPETRALLSAHGLPNVSHGLCPRCLDLALADVELWGGRAIA